MSHRPRSGHDWTLRCRNRSRCSLRPRLLLLLQQLPLPQLRRVTARAHAVMCRRGDRARRGGAPAVLLQLLQQLLLAPRVQLLLKMDDRFLRVLRHARGFAALRREE